jgi:hypothetical protein
MGEQAGINAEQTTAEQPAVDATLDSMAELYESLGQEDSAAAGLVDALRERTADLDHVGEVLDGRRGLNTPCKE